MPVQLINPEKLFKPEVYRQVAIGTGARQVHVAGQVAYDAQGQLVSLGDLTGQVAQAYRNVGAALAAAGATFKDVVRLTVFMVDWKLEKMPAFLAGVEQAAQDFDLAPAPVSLIGVAALYEPGILVEVEATAVVFIRCAGTFWNRYAADRAESVPFERRRSRSSFRNRAEAGAR